MTICGITMKWLLVWTLMVLLWSWLPLALLLPPNIGITGINYQAWQTSHFKICSQMACKETSKDEKAALGGNQPIQMCVINACVEGWGHSLISSMFAWYVWSSGLDFKALHKQGPHTCSPSAQAGGGKRTRSLKSSSVLRHKYVLKPDESGHGSGTQM